MEPTIKYDFTPLWTWSLYTYTWTYPGVIRPTIPAVTLNKPCDAILATHTKKRICVDLDGVVCEYDFPWMVKEHFGVELKTKDIYAYDLANVLGVSPDEINKMFHKQIYGKPKLIPGAVETLRDWRSKGYDIIIYSNRVKYMTVPMLIEWLIIYQIPFSRLASPIDIKGLDCYDYHIDDSPSKLMSTNSKTKILFNQPWNEKCLNIKGKLIRVDNWTEINYLI